MSVVAGRTPRWVLDTNVALSALIRPGGMAGRLRLAWQARLFVPLTDKGTAGELIRVLAYPKFRSTAMEQHELLADYLPWTEAVRLPEPPPAVPPCRDPDDMRFLQLAYAAKADALVSGDADLLTLASASRIKVMTLAEAVAELSGG